MTTSHLITNGDLSLLCNINTYCLIYSRAQLIAVLSCKYLGIYDNTIFTVGYFKGSITYLSCLLTKDGTKETLLSSKLCLSLRSNLTNKDITGTYLSTDTDDTTLIQIFQSVIADTRNITCDLFRSQLGITGFCLIFLDMDRCINIVLYKSLAKQNGILVVITFQVINPISGFLPSASSPLDVDGPSAITCPASTCSPWNTIGLWL